MDNAIIAMASIPGRAKFLDKTLRSLLDQTTGAPQIVIYLPERYKRFSVAETNEHRATVAQIIKPMATVTIKPVKQDLGPLTKMACAVTDSEIRLEFQRVVLVDDDLIYSPTFLVNFDGHPKDAGVSQSANWLDTFTNYKTNSNLNYGKPLKSRSISYRLSRVKQLLTPKVNNKPPPHTNSGYAQLIEGWSGVSVNPIWFDEEILDIPERLMNADDVCISGYLESKKIGKYVPGGCELPDDKGGSQVNGLKSLIDSEKTTNAVYSLAKKDGIFGAVSYFKSLA